MKSIRQGVFISSAARLPLQVFSDGGGSEGREGWTLACHWQAEPP